MQDQSLGSHLRLCGEKKQKQPVGIERENLNRSRLRSNIQKNMVLERDNLREKGICSETRG